MPLYRCAFHINIKRILTVKTYSPWVITVDSLRNELEKMPPQKKLYKSGPFFNHSSPGGASVSLFFSFFSSWSSGDMLLSFANQKEAWCLICSASKKNSVTIKRITCCMTLLGKNYVHKPKKGWFSLEAQYGPKSIDIGESYFSQTQELEPKTLVSEIQPVDRFQLMTAHSRHQATCNSLGKCSLHLIVHRWCPVCPVLRTLRLTCCS